MSQPASRLCEPRPTPIRHPSAITHHHHPFCCSVCSCCSLPSNTRARCSRPASMCRGCSRIHPTIHPAIHSVSPVVSRGQNAVTEARARANTHTRTHTGTRAISNTRFVRGVWSADCLNLSSMSIHRSRPSVCTPSSAGEGATIGRARVAAGPAAPLDWKPKRHTKAKNHLQKRPRPITTSTTSTTSAPSRALSRPRSNFSLQSVALDRVRARI